MCLALIKDEHTSSWWQHVAASWEHMATQSGLYAHKSVRVIMCHVVSVVSISCSAANGVHHEWMEGCRERVSALVWWCRILWKNELGMDWTLVLNAGETVTVDFTVARAG